MFQIIDDNSVLTREEFAGHMMKKPFPDRRCKRRRRSPKKILDIVFLPDSEPILQGLQTVQNDFDRVRFAGMGDEKLVQYAVLAEKIRQNIQKTLL